MLGGHPCPSPLSRPPAATGDMREAVAHGAEGSDEMPKPRGGARPGTGRPRRPRKPPGRPPHVPTGESRRFVGALVTILNLNHEQVAAVMGLNPEDAAQALPRRAPPGQDRGRHRRRRDDRGEVPQWNWQGPRLAKGRQQPPQVLCRHAARLAREDRRCVGRPPHHQARAGFQGHLTDARSARHPSPPWPATRLALASRRSSGSSRPSASASAASTASRPSRTASSSTARLRRRPSKAKELMVLLKRRRTRRSRSAT